MVARGAKYFNPCRSVNGFMGTFCSMDKSNVLKAESIGMDELFAISLTGVLWLWRVGNRMTWWV